MPINPNALGGAASDPEPAERQPDEHETHDAQGQPKRTRRTKAQMIADAPTYADDEKVELKDAGTGAKIERPWLVAVEMVRDGKAEWADKAMKYSLMKFDQQKASSAFEPPAETDPVEPVATEEQVAKSASVPPDAEIGDEVRVGSDTFRVGHGGVLTNSPIAVDGEAVPAKRRWQRALGSGIEGPWESVALEFVPATPKKSETNGKGGEVAVQTERQPMDVERVGELTWKVGTGILEKIGLPDYSSLQIGPVSASRMAVDDGRRTTVTLGDRQAAIPTAVIEAFQEVSDTVEYIVRYQRGELISFLESTGALKQPVS